MDEKRFQYYEKKVKEIERRLLVDKFIENELCDEKINLIHRNRKVFDFIDGALINSDFETVEELLNKLYSIRKNLHPSLLKSARVMTMGFSEKFPMSNTISKYLKRREKKR